MSIFGQLKKSRQSAKKYNAKLAEKKRKEAEKTPYRHVPTHAAIDAITSAPPYLREDDRTKIVEAHRRRSAMAAASYTMGLHPSPRLGSGLSFVSYPPTGPATPTVYMSRPHSCYSNSPNGPYALTRTQDGAHLAMNLNAAHDLTCRGKEAAKPAGHGAPGASPASCKGDGPPEEIGSWSTGSSDDLDMPAHCQNTKAGLAGDAAQKPLHRASAPVHDASIERRSLVRAARSKGRSPASTPGHSRNPSFTSPTPPWHVGNAEGSWAQPNVCHAKSRPMCAHACHQSSVTSLLGPSQASSEAASSGPSTPSASSTGAAEYPVFSFSLPSSDLDSVVSSGIASIAANATTTGYNDRRALKYAQFHASKRIDSTIVAQHHGVPVACGEHVQAADPADGKETGSDCKLQIAFRTDGISEGSIEMLLPQDA